MREWNIRIVLVNENTGEDVPANVFEKATYKLHPTFGARETQGTFSILLGWRERTDVGLLNQWSRSHRSESRKRGGENSICASPSRASTKAGITSCCTT